MIFFSDCNIHVHVMGNYIFEHVKILSGGGGAGGGGGGGGLRQCCYVLLLYWQTYSQRSLY